MKRTRPALAAGLLAALLTTGAAPGGDEAARTAEEEGRWPEAVAAWKDLAAGGERRPVEEYLRVLTVVGDWDVLESRARTEAGAHPGWDAPWIALARSLASRGREAEALRALEGASSPGLLLLTERALLHHGNAEREEANRVMQDVVKRYGRVSGPTPRQRYAIARAHRYLGNFEESSRLYQIAYRDSADYLEARLEVATLFREKYQANLAAEELHDAQNLYPNHPDVHLVTARNALQGNRLAQAEEEARLTLEARPQDSGARAILARLAIISEQPEAAREWIAPVLQANPRDLAARSEFAAAAYMDGDTDAYEAEVERVLAQDPGYLDVFLELAGLLDFSRRNEEAFALYDRVLARDPDNAAALIESGLLHMREGREVRARELLEKGFAGDPFNIRAYNQLELLDLMDTFTAYTTEHFEIRLDADTDSLFVPLLKESLEAIYRDLVPRHGWAPEVRTIVEVFPSHDWFSARVTGLPWIGGVPAVCFGDVVATDSPRTLAGKSNWREILKHEFGHVLALGMTQRRVPFWFTEGLSVFLEDYPREATWDANLVGFYVDDDLVPVDSLTIAFTRPRSHAQRLLAYHEAGLIIGDLVERKGWDVVPRLLEAFGRGRTLDEALREVAGTNLRDFSASAMEAVRAEAERLPLWPAPNRQRMARLTARAAEGTDTAEFLELLAITQYQFLSLDDAEKTAKKLLQMEADNVRAHGILGLLAHARRTEPAAERLETAIRLGSTDIPVYQALIGIRLAERDTTAALVLCDRVLEIYPNTVPTAMLRARLLERTGDVVGARAQYRDVTVRDNTVPTAGFELARLDLAAENAEGALAAVQYAEGIIGPEAELEALRGRAFLLMDRDDEAYRRFLYARRLNIKSVETMVGMALYYLKRSDLDEAAYFANLALRYDPEHAVAKDVLAQVRAD